MAVPPIPVEDRPYPKIQRLGTISGVVTGEILFEAATSETMLGVRLVVNPGDDQTAADTIAGQLDGQIFIPTNWREPIYLGGALITVGLVGVQSGATNTAPTSGYAGAIKFNEATAATILDADVYRSLGFTESQNLQKIVVTVSPTWGSGRYCMARIEAY